MKKLLFTLGLLFLLTSGLFGLYERFLRTTFFVAEVAATQDIIGTPPREEKEYKIAIEVPHHERPLELNTKLNDILLKIVQEEGWQAPAHYKQTYFITTSEDTFVFRDIYFDTPDDLLDSKNSALRLRWRWDSNHSYREHLKGSFSRESMPTRVEIQSKVGRAEKGEGFSEVQESRMEFAKDAHPIKNFYDEGKARLLLPFFFETIKTGRFDSNVHTPAHSIAQNVRLVNQDLVSVQLIPKVLILARRHRFHLNLVTPWGSGPNPKNAFIVTIDRYRGTLLPPSAKWESDLKRFDLSKAEESVELEIEFERNTSTRLEDEIERLEKAHLHKELETVRNIQNLFASDHKKLAQEIIKHLQMEGYRLDPKNVSKAQIMRARLKK